MFVSKNVYMYVSTHTYHGKCINALRLGRYCCMEGCVMCAVQHSALLWHGSGGVWRCNALAWRGVVWRDVMRRGVG